MTKNSFVAEVTFKGFELTYDCLIIYFPVVFPEWNICRKFEFASMNVSKVIARRKLKKSPSDCKISGFLKFSTLLFWTIECFPIKKPFSFFNHRKFENFMVYGNKHHSLTRKIGFRVISSFIIDQSASKILISFCKTKFFLTYSVPTWISKKFKILKFSLSQSPLGTETVQQISEF